jgi:uncharacterized damage-inducible protein DinB
VALPQPLVIRIPARARSPEVGSFFAQLDDLSRRMFENLADAKPAELAWQPRRGMNTIGMLLAHCAITEAYWLQLATGVSAATEADRQMKKLIGVPADFDGMPAKPTARPARTLVGWTIGRYRRLHDRARRFAKRRAARLGRADLEKVLRLRRPNGTLRLASPRWILYHVLEHQAGHYGQMLLLRHQYRDRRKQ